MSEHFSMRLRMYFSASEILKLLAIAILFSLLHKLSVKQYFEPSDVGSNIFLIDILSKRFFNLGIVSVRIMKSSEKAGEVSYP